MEYKLTSIEVVITPFSSPIVLAAVAVSCLIVGYCFIKAESRRVKLLLFAVFVFTALSIPLLNLARLPFGWDWYGYELTDNKLHIKSWPVDEIVDLKGVEVFLTNSSEWRPKIRVFGEGTTYLSMGYYRLENGVEAIVFRHKNNDKFVVINASGKYYVIIHPGVEELYNEIVGVKNEV